MLGSLPGYLEQAGDSPGSGTDNETAGPEALVTVASVAAYPFCQEGSLVTM